MTDLAALMIKFRVFTFIACTFLLLMLSACGWHLRGVGSNGGYFSKSAIGQDAQLNIHFTQRNTPLSSVFNRVTQQSGIALSAEAPLTLVIENEKLERRPLAVTDTGVTAQYQLTLIIRFNYQAQGGELRVAPTQMSSWRNYDFDPRLIAAKSQEEDALVKEMREELAVRILAAAR